MNVSHSIQAPSIKMKNDRRLLILACSVLERELHRFQNGQIEFKFLDHGLHRTPENMELQGSPQLFKELVCGPWKKNFLIVEKGQSVQQEMFLDL
jgi:hypothetical protein